MVYPLDRQIFRILRNVCFVFFASAPLFVFSGNYSYYDCINLNNIINNNNIANFTFPTHTEILYTFDIIAGSNELCISSLESIAQHRFRSPGNKRYTRSGPKISNLTSIRNFNILLLLLL